MTGNLSNKNIDTKHIDTWVFDLDNTLYPIECDLFSQVSDRMGQFISNHFQCDLIQARTIQKDYYRRYGTTLKGLMDEHGLDPTEFLDYVHQIDLSEIPKAPELADAIAKLPGNKFIYTNGSTGHAENVAGHLGILHLFDGVFDIVKSNYVPKPAQISFSHFVDTFKISPTKAVMFEDLPQNLKPAAELGLKTVLVVPADGDHPDKKDHWPVNDLEVDYIHHRTSDITHFLNQLG